MPEKGLQEPSVTNSSTMELWAPTIGNEITHSKFPSTLANFVKDNYSKKTSDSQEKILNPKIKKLHDFLKHQIKMVNPKKI